VLEAAQCAATARSCPTAEPTLFFTRLRSGTLWATRLSAVSAKNKWASSATSSRCSKTIPLRDASCSLGVVVLLKTAAVVSFVHYQKRPQNRSSADCARDLISPSPRARARSCWYAVQELHFRQGSVDTFSTTPLHRRAI